MPHLLGFTLYLHSDPLRYRTLIIQAIGTPTPILSHPQPPSSHSRSTGCCRPCLLPTLCLSIIHASTSLFSLPFYRLLQASNAGTYIWTQLMLGLLYLVYFVLQCLALCQSKALDVW